MAAAHLFDRPEVVKEGAECRQVNFDVLAITCRGGIVCQRTDHISDVRLCGMVPKGTHELRHMVKRHMATNFSLFCAVLTLCSHLPEYK
jgi:hypothetical protein